MNIDQILKRPIITEKSLQAASFGQYTFEVNQKAAKPEIARAVEQLFGVHVRAVKIINLKGKTRRVGPRRRLGVTSSRPKAVVFLNPSEKIDLFSIPGQEEVKPKVKETKEKQEK